MKTTIRKLLGGLALAATLALPAQAVPLSTLLGGGSLTAGDKLFDQWTLLSFSATGSQAFDPATLDVTPLSDGGLDPGPGLRFTFLGGGLSVTGEDAYAFVDLMFGYRVSVLAPGLFIDDASMADLFAGIGSTSGLNDGSNDNGVYLHEMIGTAPGLDDLGAGAVLGAVEFSILDGVTSSAPTASQDVLPRSREAWITNNVIVWATDSTDDAAIIEVTQRFSQTAIPEPASGLLVLLALAGAGAARRRR